MFSLNPTLFRSLYLKDIFMPFLIGTSKHPYLLEDTFTRPLMLGIKYHRNNVRITSTEDRAREIFPVRPAAAVAPTLAINTPSGVWSSAHLSYLLWVFSQILLVLLILLFLLLFSPSTQIYESISSFSFEIPLGACVGWILLHLNLYVLITHFLEWGLEMLLSWVDMLRGFWFYMLILEKLSLILTASGKRGPHMPTGLAWLMLLMILCISKCYNVDGSRY